MNIKCTLLLLVLSVLSGCTSVKVSQVDAAFNDMDYVCIENNPDVIVDDFVGVVRDRFSHHGIATEVFYRRNTPDSCRYTMTYTANKTWDMAMYMHHAELRLFNDGRRIGYAEYHLNGKGGLALNKWASVESKMNPVIDELLSELRISPKTAGRLTDNQPSMDPFDRLQRLERLKESNLISEQEYKNKKREIFKEL